jgi:hypothetical protein
MPAKMFLPAERHWQRMNNTGSKRLNRESRLG